MGDAEHNLQLHQDGKGKDFLHEANEKKACYSELHRLIGLRAIDAGDEGIINDPTPSITYQSARLSMKGQALERCTISWPRLLQDCSITKGRTRCFALLWVLAPCGYSLDKLGWDSSVGGGILEHIQPGLASPELNVLNPLPAGPSSLR